MNPSEVPPAWILIFSTALFCIGLAGVLARRNAILVLVGVELMLNAANVNLVAFASRGHGQEGLLFALFSIAIAAAEAAVGLALILAVWRSRGSVQLDEVNND